MSAMLERIARALRPLAETPPQAFWNHNEIDDLLPERLRDAAVLVGVVDRPAAPQLLLTRRTEHLRQHAGQVSFPGGAVEALDADAVATALRETREETGIAASMIEPLGYLDPMATVTGFRVVPVVARIDPAYHAQPDPGEVAEVFELPLDFVLATDTLFHAEVPWQGRVRRIAELVRWPKRDDLRVWGATAIILDNLRQRLDTHP